MNERVKALLEQVRQTADFGYVTFDDINSTNALGDSALHCVCVWGDIEAARVLIDAGININQKGEHEYTPLAVAEAFEHTDIAELLRSLGAVSHKGTGDTPSDRAKSAEHLRRLGELIVALEKEIEDKCS
jgi:ankyrin repeat protein